MGLCNDYFSVELRSFFYHINKFTIATCFAILEKIKTYFKKVRIYLEAVAKFEKKIASSVLSRHGLLIIFKRGGVGKVYWDHTEVVNDTSEILNASIISK